MSPSEDAKLEILHRHYEDSCSIVSGFRERRDRYFTRIMLLLVFVLYDFSSPYDFGRLITDLIREKGGIAHVPDLHYLSTLLWFTLLGFVVRYCQAAVHLDRQYGYLHTLEEELAPIFGGVAFTREGVAYLGNYPAFSKWAHNLYTVAFPILLGAIVVTRAYREALQLRSASAIGVVDLAISVALLVSLALYVYVLHGAAVGRWIESRWTRPRRTPPKS